MKTSFTPLSEPAPYCPVHRVQMIAGVWKFRGYFESRVWFCTAEDCHKFAIRDTKFKSEE